MFKSDNASSPTQGLLWGVLGAFLAPFLVLLFLEGEGAPLPMTWIQILTTTAVLGTVFFIIDIFFLKNQKSRRVQFIVGVTWPIAFFGTFDLKGYSRSEFHFIDDSSFFWEPFNSNALLFWLGFLTRAGALWVGYLSLRGRPSHKARQPVQLAEIFVLQFPKGREM